MQRNTGASVFIVGVDGGAFPGHPTEAFSGEVWSPLAIVGVGVGLVCFTHRCQRGRFKVSF